MGFKIGDKVKTKVEKCAYGGADIYIPKDSVGLVGAVNVPPVSGHRKGFNCVDFTILGGKVRASYYNEEIIKEA